MQSTLGYFLTYLEGTWYPWISLLKKGKGSSAYSSREVMAIAVRSLPFSSDACSRPPTSIRPQDLHGGDIRGACGWDSFLPWERLALPLLRPYGLCVFWPFFGLPFLSPVGWFRPSIFYWNFLLPIFTE